MIKFCISLIDNAVQGTEKIRVLIGFDCIKISAFKNISLIGLFDYNFLNALNFTKMENNVL